MNIILLCISSKGRYFHNRMQISTTSGDAAYGKFPNPITRLKGGTNKATSTATSGG